MDISGGPLFSLLPWEQQSWRGVWASKWATGGGLHASSTLDGLRKKSEREELRATLLFCPPSGWMVVWFPEIKNTGKGGSLEEKKKIKFLFKTLTHKVRQYHALPSWTSHARMAPHVKGEMPHRYRRRDGKHAVEDPVNSGGQGEVWAGNVIPCVVSIQWSVEEEGSQSQKCARLGSCCF